MKTKLFAGLIAVMFLIPALAFAQPERITIKSTEGKNREEQAKEKLKTIHLSRISDPEARKAIKEILNYLNLPSAQN